ncbi:adenylyltransferase/cytidyltransferase family protein [Streptomyces actinomycinicus]|uniref:Adenylyltransferase/cytidyltransferase family protein n=1 Tax=Streptomyces actinomycinicus TaxID=1695166 RepID=A0A937EIZ3_9ACTN|nr:adenylyltransferase/cytidyltransferase family protein [Streptomyces actinomycinicus]MBL1083026.1 adenylyltransferase/cytidyltransferase family protein [Streptomyces actinomycinicus]
MNGRAARRHRLGYAPGVYDLFHVGHLNILRRARQQCDRLVAGVVADERVLQQKGRRPVVPLAERLDIVRSLQCVDEAVVEATTDKMEMWKEIGFDVVFKGDDWRGTELWNTLEHRFAQVGVKVVYFPYTPHTSSTLLRTALDVLAGQPADRTGLSRAGGSS